MNITEIIPNLWMGGELRLWEPAGFDVVLNVRVLGEATLFFGREYSGATLHMPLIDEAKPVSAWKINSAIRLIEEALAAHLRVLMHCAEGHNRSGLIIGAYLILSAGMTPDDAIELIRAKRPGALSNQTFVEQLHGLKALT